MLSLCWQAPLSVVFTKHMKPSDKELLADCRRGEETAWEELVHRYQRLIFTIPRRAGLDEDQSADVFQEVFATLLRKLNDIDEPERLHAWLVTTARRTTWRVISKAQVSADDSEGLEEKLAAMADNAALPDEVLMQLEEQLRVRRGLTRLDERCQKLLKLLFYESEPLSYAEIAALLGTSEGSIGPTRARCLEKLLRLLERDLD
jgi:RNA polymerase sigma factor (sigma-70 family)